MFLRDMALCSRGKGAQWTCQEEGLQLNLVSMNSLLKAVTSSWLQAGCLGWGNLQQTDMTWW